MAYNTTSSLHKLRCTGYVDFGKGQDRFEHISSSQKDSNYLDVKLKVFKKDDNKELHKERHISTSLCKCQDSFEQFYWSKIDSNYLEVEFKVFKRNNNRAFRLVQTLTNGEADFNQFMRLRNHLVIAEEKIAREENLSPVLVPTMSKDMDERFKLVHKVFHVVDRANRKIAVQCGKAREFICSTTPFCKEEGER